MAQPRPYSMSVMTTALPQVPFRPGPPPGRYAPGQPQGQPPQRFSPAMASPGGMVGQLPTAPYGAPAAMTMTSPQYYVPQQPPHPGQPQYYSGLLPPPAQVVMGPQPGIVYYGSPIGMNQQAPPNPPYYFAQPAPFPGPPQQLLHTPAMGGQPTAPQIDPAHSRGNDLIVSSSYATGLPDVVSEKRQSVVRGPPRKPRQSGHAIWIGNLPPQTDLMSLVHHVCAETDGLESLFLISKSNCAFANFKDESTCVAAQQKLHDSKFQSVRLVSRLRKSTVEGTAGLTAPTGPAASMAQTLGPVSQEAVANPHKAKPRSDESTAVSCGPRESNAASSPHPSSTPVPKDRYFILKSLTVEDLDLSVRTKIWATQSHNEEALSQAFQSVENVYLVFSANKSGEYFGYARMMSAINQDPAAAIEFASKVQSPADLDVPKAIPTEADEHAPKGRIIDDSARGIIFWELATPVAGPGPEPDGQGPDGQGPDGQGPDEPGPDGPGPDGPKAQWGKPFQLEWLSTARLPFYRTRGLRNPWNSNKEVKIARDGTELEPEVGRRLISLFNCVQSPAPPMVPTAPGVPRVPGMPAAPGLFDVAAGVRPAGRFRGAGPDVVGPGFVGDALVGGAKVEYPLGSL